MQYNACVTKFAMAWNAFKWRGTVWVHWAIAHSGFLLRTHGSIYLFSSIPTEHKHKGFKVDMRHTFHARVARCPRVSRGVVDNHGLDAALRIEQNPRVNKKRLRTD